MPCGGVHRLAAVAIALASAPAGALAAGGTPTSGIGIGGPGTGGWGPNLSGNPNVCVSDFGSRGWCGDDGPATSARIAGPQAVAPSADGGFLIADTQNDAVRKVSRDGTISTVAGIGFAGDHGDGGPADLAGLDSPGGVAALPKGGFIIADTANHRVRRVDRRGRITTIAGTGDDASSRDGGRAKRSALRAPRGLAVAPDGSIVIADSADNRVRRVTPDGRIVTLAGTGVAGRGGDGGPARDAMLDGPTGVAVEPNGGVLIADRGNQVVRRVAPDGSIATAAGGASAGPPALQAKLQFPTAVSSTGDGGFLIAEDAVVHRVGADGSVAVVAGTGSLGFNGDSGPATSLTLSYVTSVAALPGGAALIADQSSDRIRLLSGIGTLTTVAGFDTPPPLPPPGPRTRPARAQAVTAGVACASSGGGWEALRVRPLFSSVSARTGRPMTITLETSLSAVISTEIYSGSRRVAAHRAYYRVDKRRRKYRFSVRFRRAPAAGRYAIRLVGRALEHHHPRLRCVSKPLSVGH